MYDTTLSENKGKCTENNKKLNQLTQGINIKVRITTQL